MKRSRRLLLGTIALALVAWPRAGATTTTSSRATTTRRAAARKLSGSITLAVNPWDGSRRERQRGEDHPREAGDDGRS